MTSCAGEPQPQATAEQKPITWIPLRTKGNQFVYVDSAFNKQLKQTFYHAQPFTVTGYALVGDEKNQRAVINFKGDLMEDYSTADLQLLPLGKLTLLMKRQEYDKKLPFWKWNWHIMGGDVEKTATYVQVEIRVLETGQVLLHKDIPYDQNSYNLAAYSLDDSHVVLNQELYRIDKQRFKKVKGNIEAVLENGRYIPASTASFSIYDIRHQDATQSGLSGTDAISLHWKNQSLVLDSINQERYTPSIPKLLKDRTSGDTYAFPQYDKAFPKQIRQARPKQLAFLNEVTLVYSVANSPYFILGKFNYDDDIWAYEWLYIDKDGNLLDQIQVNDFFILDQVGNLVWPDKQLLFTANTLKKDWKTGKIKYLYQMDDRYLIDVKKGELDPTMGLWNAAQKNWDLLPDFNHIEVLNGPQQILALQEHSDGPYILYNNKTKQRIGSKSYHSIYADGLVQVKGEGSVKEYYYIDIATGREYKE